MIKAILFDFGGVYTQSPFETLRVGAAELGIDPDVLHDIVFGPYDRDTDHPWHRLERGELTLLAAREELIALALEAGHDVDPFHVLRSMAVGDDAADAFVSRTIELRAAGYATALITNNLAEFRDAWRKLVPADEMFDIVVDSSVVGMRKPDPRIFHFALSELGGIDPENSVFLDDAPGNVEAARAIGIHGIHVGSDRLAAIAELDLLLADH